MDNKVSTRIFFEIWKNVVLINSQRLKDNWQNANKFTSLIKGEENSILSSIGKILNLEVYESDYYSLDAIFYDKDDLCPKIKENTFWLRNIKIAFEHENAFNLKLCEEISHLIITNCDLRVLVTYPNSEEEGEEILVYFSDIIKGNRKEKEFSENEEILVIFGYESDFVWNGYIYNTNGWINIQK